MSRERILMGGAPGTGKTFAWLTIARANPDVTFHVIDPDDGVIRVWQENVEGQAPFANVKNINYYFTPFWYGTLNPHEIGQIGGVHQAYLDIKSKAKPNDWIVVEMISQLWQMVQGAFVQEIFNEGIGEYFLKARKNMKASSGSLNPLEGWTDWQVINRMHNDDFIIPLNYRLPCHTFITSSVSVLSGSNSKEDPEVKSFYGDSKIRFEGQKHNVFRAQSIFIVSRNSQGQWQISTILKDRGRAWMVKEVLYDFSLQYLRGKAGWGS